MKNGAWRPYRPLRGTLLASLITLPIAARAGTPAEFVSYCQNAYARGQDLPPGPRTPADTMSIAKRLDLQSVSPEAALSASAFLVADRAVVSLAGVQGCLSADRLEYADVVATCAMISLAGLTAVVGEAKASAGNAFPFHELTWNPGRPTVRFAECFFMEEGAVRSLSETLIIRGVAFASRDGSGRPRFPEYARAEEAARNARAGIWANAHFAHPCGERYHANPTKL
ncbi:Micrococcal nuclease-like nuclease [Neorhizobium galegae bv. officinalis]|nr:Micrococcal nuclease-like nuclease [Neorhizobium galegae bv. officinalis]